MPDSTLYVEESGRDTFIFVKNTELRIPFTIAIYYDPDERGYCAQLLTPKIEEAWKNAHVGHLFSDGIICLGGGSMRTRQTMRESYAKACLWAEGMAAMITSHLAGEPSEFPFSRNNDAGDIK